MVDTGWRRWCCELAVRVVETRCRALPAVAVRDRGALVLALGAGLAVRMVETGCRVPVLVL